MGIYVDIGPLCTRATSVAGHSTQQIAFSFTDIVFPIQILFTSCV